MEEEIKNYSKELRTLIDKSQESFEKQLNYISAGALGLSMVIIEKIVKDLSQTCNNWILIMSWSFLGLTLFSNLVSHIYTSRIHAKTINEIEADKYDYQKATRRNKRITNWNLTSVLFLLLGILFQIIFISINI